MFREGKYEEALRSYYEAVDWITKYKLKDKGAFIQLSCAEACLKLAKNSDAYAHTSECIHLDPQSHKGYFQRAETLKLMLQSSATENGTYMDVVKDYIACHSLQNNLEAFCKAVVLAVEHGMLV